MSAFPLLKTYREKHESQLRLATKRATLNGYREIIGATTDMDSADDEEVYLPVNGRWYAQTGLDRPL